MQESGDQNNHTCSLRDRGEGLSDPPIWYSYPGQLFCMVLFQQGLGIVTQHENDFAYGKAIWAVK